MGLLSGSLASLLLLLQVSQCLALVLTQIAPWRAGGVLTLRASGGGGRGGTDLRAVFLGAKDVPEIHRGLLGMGVQNRALL